MFGEKYAGAEEALRIYIYCTIFFTITGISSRWFIIYNNQRIMSFYLIASAFINIALNLFLIPKYGISGAALASVIPFSFSATFSNLLHSQTVHNFELQCLAVIYPFVLIYKNFKRNTLNSS
jgi:polysaccharide transporter, PST family